MMITYKIMLHTLLLLWCWGCCSYWYFAENLTRVSIDYRYMEMFGNLQTQFCLSYACGTYNNNKFLVHYCLNVNIKNGS